MSITDASPYLVGPVIAIVGLALTSAFSASAALRRRLAADVALVEGATGTAASLLRASIDVRVLRLVAAVQYPRLERSDTPAFVVMSFFVAFSTLGVASVLTGPIDEVGLVAALAAPSLLASVGFRWPAHLISQRAGQRVRFFREHLEDPYYIAEVRVVHMWAWVLGGVYSVTIGGLYGTIIFGLIREAGGRPGPQRGGALVTVLLVLLLVALICANATRNFWERLGIDYAELLRSQRPGRLAEFQEIREARLRAQQVEADKAARKSAKPTKRTARKRRLWRWRSIAGNEKE